MKNVIKKGLILLLFNLCLSIPSISQTTSADTLKAISLIFNEHEKLSIENPLLKQQISSLEKINNLNLKIDSIRRIEIQDCKSNILFKDQQIEELKLKQKKIILESSVAGIVLFILGLIL